MWLIVVFIKPVCSRKGHIMVYPITEDVQLRNHETHISDAKKALNSREV